MPLPISLAIVGFKASRASKNNVLKMVNARCKVSSNSFYENGKPKYIDTVVLSTQHSAELTLKKLLNL